MVDLIAFGIVLLTVLVVMFRKTSAGVAVLGLLAGVMLDQLLGAWIIGLLPSQATGLSEYVPVVVHLLVTFAPVVASLVAVKVARHNAVLSLLTSLVLGFLIMYFGLKIVSPLPLVAEAAKNSGLLHFLEPYQNAILAASAILAITEMIISHHTKDPKEKKKKKH